MARATVAAFASEEPTASIAAFAAIMKRRRSAHYRGDGNRIDLAFFLHALAYGESDDAIRTSIQTRDLSKKGSEPRQLAYVARTIEKAKQTISRRSTAR